jgi:lipoprotein-anchoring transpeptidase ErfK/SrfK
MLIEKQFSAPFRLDNVLPKLHWEVRTMITALLPALILINLSQNTLSYLEFNQTIRSWNIGTARPGKVTPTGWFEVLEKELCPPFFGPSGHPTFIPGCAPTNPFGEKILWFIGHSFGIHGTNQPWLIDSSTSANERRISGGCVRNAPENIDWLYEKASVGMPILIKW